MPKPQTANALFITVCLLLVAAVWLFIVLLPRPAVVVLPREAGVTDLRAADFDRAIYAYTDKHWANYPEALLTPADFAGASPPVASPMSAADYRAVQYASHRLRLRLPPGRIYAVTLDSAEFAMRLYIDGAEAGLVGVPGATRETNTPRVAPQTYYFQPEGEITAILVQTANWVYRSGAYPPDFHIGSAANIDTYNRHTQGLTFFITGALITAFLYHLGQYALNRRRSVALMFALCCLLLAELEFRPYKFFPDYNWYATLRLEFIIHYLTFAVLCRFLELLFPRLYPRPVTRAFYALAGLYILSAFLLDTKWCSLLIVSYQAISAGLTLYTLVRLAVQLRERKTHNILAFVGMLPVCLFGLIDLLSSSRVLSLVPIAGQHFVTPIAMCFFASCYAMVVALEYADTEQSLRLERRQVEALSLSNAALDRMSHMRSDIIATISHESRTPLAVLASYAGLVSMELKDKNVDEQIAADLDTIAFEAKRVANLIDGMRKLSQQKEVKAERAVLDAGEIMRQTTRLYEPIITRGDIRLETKITGGSFPVFGNAEELTQVILNLLQNAKNHTARGTVSASVCREGGEITVTVADTGAGIEAQLLPHVFERGVAGERGGTGIGLAICKEVAESHGGRIAIVSEPGRGTAVTVSLPLWQA